jgi:hypothetical protein
MSKNRGCSNSHERWASSFESGTRDQISWSADRRTTNFVLIAAVLDRGPEKTFEIPIADTYDRTYIPSRGADRPTKFSTAPARVGFMFCMLIWKVYTD